MSPDQAVLVNHALRSYISRCVAAEHDENISETATEWVKNQRAKAEGIIAAYFPAEEVGG